MRFLLLTLAAVSIPALGSGEPPASPQPSPAATPAPAAKLQNTLRWQTASEVENLGFDVYRATEEKGPFTKITARPIPGAGTTDEPKSYSYSDDTIEAGKAYWYYVESISMSGVREKFTPTFKAPIKGGTPAPAATPAAKAEPKKEAPAPH